MRLIDLDALLKEFDEWEEDLKKDGLAERALGIVDASVIAAQQPTVDAIPIEFIRKWVLANGYKRQSGWLITLRNLEKLIKEWEMENGN